MKKICSRLWGFLLLPVYLFASLGLHVCETEAATVKLESKVYNPGGNTLSDYWKCTNEDVLTWLGKHINDDYYLGTSYDTGSLDSSNGDSRNDCDWRSPKGDISTRDGHPGFNDVAGQAAMNCTGFVWHVIYKAGQLAGNDWSKSEEVLVQEHGLPGLKAIMLNIKLIGPKSDMTNMILMALCRK